MVAPVRCRLATSADALEIADLHAASWRENYRGNFPDAYLDGDLFEDRRATWRGRLSQPTDPQFVCVAEAESQLAGFVCVYGDKDPEWGRSSTTCTSRQCTGAPASRRC